MRRWGCRIIIGDMAVGAAYWMGWDGVEREDALSSGWSRSLLSLVLSFYLTYLLFPSLCLISYYRFSIFVFSIFRYPLFSSFLPLTAGKHPSSQHHTQISFGFFSVQVIHSARFNSNNNKPYLQHSVPYCTCTICLFSFIHLILSFAGKPPRPFRVT